MFGEGEGKRQHKLDQGKVELHNGLLNKEKWKHKTFMSVFIHTISS